MDERQQATAGHYRASFEGFRDAWAPALGALVAPFLERLIPAGAARLLDLGSGTGETSAALDRRPTGPPPLVVQADLLPFMLVEARHRHPSGAFVQLDATRLPFRDGAFDVVVSAFVWHHVREQRRGFTEVLRVLEPGGRFVFIGWGDGEEHGAAFDAWERWLADSGAPDGDPAPTPSWVDELAPGATLAGLLESLGYRILSVEDPFGNYRWSVEAFLACRSAVGGCGRRLAVLDPKTQAALLRRARRELPGLADEAFGWRPRLVVVTAEKPRAGRDVAEGAGRESAGIGRASAGAGPARACAGPAAAPGDYRTVCPNCGAPMYDRGCKTRCPRCHFFTDCSDPW